MPRTTCKDRYYDVQHFSQVKNAWSTVARYKAKKSAYICAENYKPDVRILCRRYDVPEFPSNVSVFKNGEWSDLW